MKVELVKQENRFFIISSHGAKEEVPREPNQTDLEYQNQAFLLFNKRIELYKSLLSSEEQVIKRVNI